MSPFMGGFLFASLVFGVLGPLAWGILTDFQPLPAFGVWLGMMWAVGLMGGALTWWGANWQIPLEAGRPR